MDGESNGDDVFVGAVVEKRPQLNPGHGVSPLEILATNAAAMMPYFDVASQHGAKIIVFPGFGIIHHICPIV